MAEDKSKGSKDPYQELFGEGELFAEEELLSNYERQDRSLVSDFCPVLKEEGEGDGEEGLEGEEYWVCHESEEEYMGESAVGEELGLQEEEKEEEYSLEERKSLDSEYLKKVLGTPLTFALLDIAKKRPTDPIQYLGYFLLKWKLSKDSKSEYDETVKELTAEREAYKEKLRQRERQKMLLKEQEEERLRREEKVESTTDGETIEGEEEILEEVE